MVTKYGFSSKIGLVSYDSGNEVFIGRDYEKTRDYSERTADSIDAEVRSIIEKCYSEAKRIILEHKTELTACAELLLKKEKIGRTEFESLFAAPQAAAPAGEN